MGSFQEKHVQGDDYYKTWTIKYKEEILYLQYVYCQLQNFFALIWFTEKAPAHGFVDHPFLWSHIDYMQYCSTCMTTEDHYKVLNT